MREELTGVLIADDDPVIRRLLAAVLEEAGDFFLAGEAAGADEAIALAEQHRPAIALLDYAMPGGGGPAAARGIRRVSPVTRIVALSALDDVAVVREMLSTGAASYLVKGTPVDELVATLRHVAADAPAPEPPEERTTVVVAHADAATLDAHAEAVERPGDLELVGVAQTPFHAITLVARHKPDVVVVDEGLPSGVGRLTADLAVANATSRVLAIGVAAPVSSRKTEALLRAIRRAAEGEEAAPSVQLGGQTPAVPPRRRFERLHAVLTGGRLGMVLQPIAALDGSGVVGYEALARFPAMPSPRPDIWFAEAHRAGVGVELEMLAVRSALAALPTLPEDVFLAINVSPDTAESAQLYRAMDGDHARRIVLEITEHAPVADYDGLGDALRRLRLLGVRIAVDDCGAGFASLRHVALLAPEFLKLDVVLCRDLHQPIKAALARALATFARETGSVLVAEGIEADEDLVALRSLGVQLGQGYLIGRPEALA